MVLSNITKKYGEKVVFDNLSYSFLPNKITVILGDSGVGKTTLIKIILGLTDYEGRVENTGVLACVFQNDRLLPNLSVRENLLFVNKEINVEEELEKVDMLEAIDYYPNMLSSGMSRRVDIVRALNYKCETLLMDEPLRNLDYYMKYKMIDRIKDYHSKNNNTLIIVTHDLKVAVELADRIIILKNSTGICKEITKISKDTENEILDFLIKKA